MNLPPILLDPPACPARTSKRLFHHPITASVEVERCGDGPSPVRRISNNPWVWAGLPLVLVLGACTPIPVSQQQLVSKPNMVFDDTHAFAYSMRMLPQSEPGTAVSGSAPGGGCTACR